MDPQQQLPSTPILERFATIRIDSPPPQYTPRVPPRSPSSITPLLAFSLTPDSPPIPSPVYSPSPNPSPVFASFQPAGSRHEHQCLCSPQPVSYSPYTSPVTTSSATFLPFKLDNHFSSSASHTHSSSNKSNAFSSFLSHGNSRNGNNRNVRRSGYLTEAEKFRRSRARRTRLIGVITCFTCLLIALAIGLAVAGVVFGWGEGKGGCVRWSDGGSSGDCKGK